MFTDFINSLSDLLYSNILIVLLLGTGIYFSIRTRFVQFRLFPESIRVVAQPGSDDKGLSSFQALMVSTASRVGTGNIAGISTAICLGGPGAVFWIGSPLFWEARLRLLRARLPRSTSAAPKTEVPTAGLPTISRPH